MKVAGVVLEPTYIWHDGGTGGGGIVKLAALGSIQCSSYETKDRHTLGGRAVKKFGAGSARVDADAGRLLPIRGNRYERANSTNGGPTNMDIEAYAFHIDGGVTLPVPMQPRLSAEFNTASGNKGGNDNKWRSFDQLYPDQPHSLRVYGPHVLEEHEPSLRSASKCGQTRTAISK